ERAAGRSVQRIHRSFEIQIRTLSRAAISFSRSTRRERMLFSRIHQPTKPVEAEPHRRELEVDPRFTHRARQPGLDFLRALAIIVVVIYHAALFGFKLPGRVDRFGWIGVDLFFVLSGYLIGGQLIAPLMRGRPIDLRRFFARRALRIIPAYCVILAVYAFLPPWREYPEMSPLW